MLSIPRASLSNDAKMKNNFNIPFNCFVSRNGSKVLNFSSISKKHKLNRNDMIEIIKYEQQYLESLYTDFVVSKRILKKANKDDINLYITCHLFLNKENFKQKLKEYTNTKDDPKWSGYYQELEHEIDKINQNVNNFPGSSPNEPTMNNEPQINGCNLNMNQLNTSTTSNTSTTNKINDNQINNFITSPPLSSQFDSHDNSHHSSPLNQNQNHNQNQNGNDDHDDYDENEHNESNEYNWLNDSEEEPGDRYFSDDDSDFPYDSFYM